MSPDSQSLRDRFRDDLSSGSTPVLLTAVPIAMAVGLGSTWYTHEVAGGFLLLVTIGVLVPSAHEHYMPQDRSWSRDVTWTIAASAVASGLFAGSYLLAGILLSDATATAVVAFVATYLCGWTMLRLLARSDSGGA
ncbi:hypothetical protein [Natrinema marinum]|uniref:hypothetical protein n=1 Tax=Natrinema marinum TaxID=2961598 RepID=UPI0020C8EF17|nr:hypothetical protein [Natrinema marinum]